MSTLVESLKRLYLAGKVAIEKLSTMKADGKLSEDEYNYIIS